MIEFTKPYIKQALEVLGFKDLTDVQNVVIPHLLNTQDIIVKANTGSGKTHAFLLPIFERLKEDLTQVQALILAPTRELAKQIYAFAKVIAEQASKTPVVDLYIGGMDRDDIIRRLESRQPQIAIGTPGRIFDMAVKNQALKIYTADYLIIDEADMTLEHHFADEVSLILNLITESATKAVFSATIPEQLQPFLRKYMKNPVNLDIHQGQPSTKNIVHGFIKTKEQNRFLALQKLLNVLNPYLAIVFCNTKDTCETVFNWMKDNQYNAVMIHGGIDYRKRKQLMARVAKLEFQYIVATDIISRGIDIQGISHIINYELPRNAEFYIHRTGRTGRLDFDGDAVSLYEFEDNQYLDKLEKMGIHCEYIDIIDSELKNTTLRKKRSRRDMVETELEREAKKRVPKPQKVKPGYKKKNKQKIAKERKKIAKKRR